jgi:hypothetical protein
VLVCLLVQKFFEYYVRSNGRGTPILAALVGAIPVVIIDEETRFLIKDTLQNASRKW